jgi:hypothetical protein
MRRFLKWFFPDKLNTKTDSGRAGSPSPSPFGGSKPGLPMAPPTAGALPEDELARRIEAHSKWLDTGGREGARADLKGAHLRFSNLFMARLERADLSSADLRNANVQWANLSGADLNGAKLGDADLFQSNFSGANLHDVSAKGASFFMADLQGADLGGANLRGADMKGTKLQGADLSGVDFTDAKMEGAELNDPASEGPVQPPGEERA